MQIDLNVDELRAIVNGLTHQVVYEDLLKDKLVPALEEMEELADMDFDDCAGGACKL